MGNKNLILLVSCMAVLTCFASFGAYYKGKYEERVVCGPDLLSPPKIGE